MSSSNSLEYESVEAVASYVEEYLQYHDYASTLAAFTAERKLNLAARSSGGQHAALGSGLHLGLAARGGVGAEPSFTPSERINLIREMMRCFSYGERDSFFRLWERLVPAALRRADDATRRQEFRAHVYFALFPGLPVTNGSGPDAQTPSRADALRAFHTFLNTKGVGEMAADPEFVPFYALPYVEDPRTHPSFRLLFTETWADEQTSAMAEFLNNVPAAPPRPTIYRLYDAHVGLVNEPAAAAAAAAAATAGAGAGAEPRPLSAGTALLSTDAPLDAIMSKQRGEEGGDEQGEGSALDALAQRWAEGDDAPLMASTRDGSAAAEAALRLLNEPDGAAGVPDPTQPTRISASNAGMRKSVTFHDDVVLGDDAPPARPRSAWVPAAPLHYDRVRYALTDGADDEAACILEALRWRVTRAPPGPERLAALRALITEDALGTRDSSGATCFEKCCGSDKPLYMLEQAARLANVVASDGTGRRYLTSMGPGVVNALVDLLSAQLDAHREGLAEQAEGGAPVPFDTPLVQQALGALQKLSLVRAAQTAMIERGAVSWVCDALRDPDGVLQEYTVEYGAALLMNLSLRTKGKLACEDPGIGILSVLSELLESSNPQVRTYINGTLYSIFQRAAIREQGRAMGLPEFLDLVRSQSEGTVFAKQVDYVIAQLNVEDTEEDPEADAESDDEAVGDGMGDEEEDASALDDVGEDSRSEAGYGVTMPEDVERGEPLLCRSYLADGDSANEQNARLRASLMASDASSQGGPPGPAPEEDEEAASFHTRPVTPRQRPTTAEAHAALERERAKMEAAKLASRNPDGGVQVEEAEQEFMQGFGTHDKVPRTPQHGPR